MRILIALAATTLLTGTAIAQDTIHPVAKERMLAISSAAEEQLGLELDPWGADEGCFPNVCQIMAGPVMLWTDVNGRFEADMTNQISPSEYRKICAIAFSVINEADLGFAAEITDEMFAIASANNGHTNWFGETRYSVQPDTDGLLGCVVWQDIPG